MTLCDFWHESDFLKIFTWEDKFAIIWTTLLKEISDSLKASSMLFLLHFFTETLYWTDIDLHLHSRLEVYLSWKIVDFPPSSEEQILYFEISIVGNCFESFVFLVASHCKRVHFQLKPTTFHFLSLSCWNGSNQWGISVVE